MYTVNCSVRGTSPLLQHKYGIAVMQGQMTGAGKKSSASDYSTEWMRTMYVTADGWLCQPATHIEGAMTEAGKLFTIQGRKGKTYRDVIRAYCYVSPDELLHLDDNGNAIAAPKEDLLDNPTDRLSVSVMRVKVQRAAIPRLRLQISEGWNLNFSIFVQDDQLRPDVVRTVLGEAGRAVGIGDYRPRYGRFEVTKFEVVE